MANLYNHLELESRWMPIVREETGDPPWVKGAPEDLLINYGFDAMQMTAAFFGAQADFVWREAYEDQVYGFYLMLSRIWEIAAEEADCVLDNTVTEQAKPIADAAEAAPLMAKTYEEMEAAFVKLHGERRLRDNAVIAQLMRLGRQLRRLYHDAGYLEDRLLVLFGNELKPYAPCVSRELLAMCRERK